MELSRKIESITLATFTPVTAMVAGAGKTIVAIIARRALFPGARHVDGDLAPLEILVVKLRDGLLGFIWRTVLHKGKTAGTAGHLVEHEVNRRHRARLGEVILEVVFPCLERQVADE